MGDYIINLKNIYRIIRINDYPVYSDGIFPRTRLKGLTLIKFWTQFLLPRWRNTEHGRVIWRTQGSKNRYHSELCNRKHSFPFYKEYSDEIVSILTEKEFYDQVLVFMDFLKLHKYNHDNFRKKLEKYLEIADENDSLFHGEISDYFSKALSCYNYTHIAPLLTDAWFLAMLTLHAAAGECMNDAGLVSIRRNWRYMPDQLLLTAENQASDSSNISHNMLTEMDLTLSGSSLPPYRFYGREMEIFDLAECLHESRKILLTGVSGTGKSELLRQFLLGIIKNKLDIKISVIQCSNSIAEGFLKAFPGITGTDEEDRFRKIFSLLKEESSRPSVIIIDQNIICGDHSGILCSEDAELLKAIADLPGTVVMASELDEIPGFTPYHIKDVSPDAAFLIFRYNYGKILSDKEKNALDLFLAEGKIGHPLTIRLLAKSAVCRGVSIDELAGLYGAPACESDDTDNDIGYYIDRIYFHGSFSAEELFFLQLFASLPYGTYNKKELQTLAGTCGMAPDLSSDLWLSPDSDSGSNRKNTNKQLNNKKLAALKNLTEEGWLDETGSGYSMHPLIAEHIRYTLKQIL